MKQSEVLDLIKLIDRVYKTEYAKDKDIVKLSQYAEKMGIKEEVMNYVEVFYE